MAWTETNATMQRRMERALDRTLRDAADGYGHDAAYGTHNALVCAGKFDGDVASYVGVLTAELNKNAGPSYLAIAAETDPKAAALLAQRHEEADAVRQARAASHAAEEKYAQIFDTLSEIQERRELLAALGKDEPALPEGGFKTASEMNAAYAAAVLAKPAEPKVEGSLDGKVVVLDDRRVSKTFIGPLSEDAPEDVTATNTLG